VSVNRFAICGKFTRALLAHQIFNKKIGSNVSRRSKNICHPISWGMFYFITIVKILILVPPYHVLIWDFIFSLFSLIIILLMVFIVKLLSWCIEDEEKRKRDSVYRIEVVFIHFVVPLRQRFFFTCFWCKFLFSLLLHPRSFLQKITYIFHLIWITNFSFFKIIWIVWATCIFEYVSARKIFHVDGSGFGVNDGT
jgi:hypothetical protein